MRFAIKNVTADIRTRLNNTSEIEVATGIEEVKKISKIRLDDMVSEVDGATTVTSLSKL